MPAESQTPHVRFKPSKVEGFSAAEEIEVHPDRLRILSEGRWHDVQFANIAVRRVVAWLAGVIYLGGMATRSEGGKYYVGTKGKREWEVSRHVWNYSRVHVRVTWVLLPLGMVGYFLGHGSLEVLTRRERYERAHRSIAYGPPR